MILRRLFCTHVRKMSTPKRYRYLLFFGSPNGEFRLPEITSLSKMYNIPMEIKDDMDCVNEPYLLANFPDDEAIKKVAQRSVTLKAVYELWGQGATYPDVMEDIKQFSQAYPDKWAKALAPETSFKFTMDSFGRSPPQKEQVETFEKFAWIDFQGPVQMKNADATFFISENIGRYDREALPKWIYFGRYISDTNRDIIDKFTLKKRLYLSTTSMESEISFLTASQALIKSGSLVFDPFVGSGSLLVSAAAFGAYVIGGDIDMKVLKGKEPGKNIEGNFAQYKISDHLGGLVRFDSGHGNCLRFDKLLDAIVCDPPYGVRAGARTVGLKAKTINKRAAAAAAEAPEPVEPVDKSDWKPHVTQTIPYGVPDVLTDLLDMSARSLVLGGRLVYWLPVFDPTYKDEDVPQHPCFKLIANSRQGLSKQFSRRLITMEKVIEYDPAVHSDLPKVTYNVDELGPAHANFSMKYMNDPSRHDKRDRGQKWTQQPTSKKHKRNKKAKSLSHVDAEGDHVMTEPEKPQQAE